MEGATPKKSGHASNPWILMVVGALLTTILMIAVNLVTKEYTYKVDSDGKPTGDPELVSKKSLFNHKAKEKK